jgi:hypothetical protein
MPVPIPPGASSVSQILRCVSWPLKLCFPPLTHCYTKEIVMPRKALALLFGSALVLVLSIPVLAQEASDAGAGKETASPHTNAKKGKAAGESRWEGIVIRSNKDKSTLIVRKIGTKAEKTVHYDNSTMFTSQEHGKKANHINADQIQDNDRVICLGTLDKNGDFHATLISKRLSNPLSR